MLVIDDASRDATFERGVAAEASRTLPFPLTVLTNPVNQGYGGNQKIGFHYAIEQGFDFVALVHGDGQYAPECLPDLIEPLARGGSRRSVTSQVRTNPVTSSDTNRLPSGVNSPGRIIRPVWSAGVSGRPSRRS